MPEDIDDEWRRINAFGNAPGPRDWRPPVDPLAPAPRGGRVTLNGRRGLWLGAVIGVLLVALVGGAVYVGRSHSVNAAQDRGPVVFTGKSPIAVAPTSAVQLAAGTPVGTCLAAGAPATEVFVPCTTAHRFELVSHARASGDSYPGDDYWTGPVAEQCYQDTLRYVGLPRDQWPAGLDSTSFIPVAQGWAAGDRAVYCLAAWTADATVSVKKLAKPTAPPVVVPTDTTAVLAGGLVRVANPTPRQADCVGVVSGGTTSVVMPASNAYSWWISLDGSGRAVSAESGILRGGDPLGKDFVAHLGATVRLTGTWIQYSGPSVADCGASRVFEFSAVG